MKQPQQCLIQMGNVAIGIKREHAGGNTLQYRLNVPAPLFQGIVCCAQFPAGCFNLSPADFEIPGHEIE